MTEGFAKDATSYRPGDVVAGRYRIRGVLGKGGFGAVSSGEHLGTHQVVAIKMLAVDAREVDDNVKRRFMQEARITASLGHPNTVRVFDVGQAEDGPLFLVMELLRGPTLERVLRKLEEKGEVMTELQSIDLAIPILRSLAEAHEAGLVHRDLKPANVMLAVVSGDDPVAKVLDFGLARAEDSSITGEGKSLGTPAYMSPEQCKGGEVDARSDLYSLGVILFRCVVGRLPFVASKPLALMYMHANEPAPDAIELAPQDIHPGLSDVIQRSLGKSKDERFSSAQEMREVLEVLRDECLERQQARLNAGKDAPVLRVGALTGIGTSLRQLVEQAGPLPPVLEARRAPWADDAAGPATRQHSPTPEPPTLQTESLPQREPIAGGKRVPLLAVVAVAVVVVLLAWLLRGSEAPVATTAQVAGAGARPSATAAAAAAAPPAAPPLPVAATPAEVPNANVLARRMAARKVEEALTATGQARLKLLRQAIALDPENGRLRTLLKKMETAEAEASAAVAAQPAGQPRPAAVRRTKPRRRAPAKPDPSESVVRPAIMED